MTPLLPEPGGSHKPLLDHVEDSLLPLINLVFLLLMFFIVAGQITDSTLPELPASHHDQQQRTPSADLIVQADGRWLVAGQPVTIATLIQHLPQPNDDAPLRIAAEREMTMMDLQKLLLQLEQGGYAKVLLLTEPE